jgi:hypothetical protein
MLIKRISVYLYYINSKGIITMLKLKKLLNESKPLTESASTTITGIQQNLAAIYGMDILGKWGIDGKLGSTTLNAISKALDDLAYDKKARYRGYEGDSGIPTTAGTPDEKWKTLPGNVLNYFNTKIGGAQDQAVYTVIDDLDSSDFGMYNNDLVTYDFNYMIAADKGDQFITDTGIQGTLKLDKATPNIIDTVDSNAPASPNINPVAKQIDNMKLDTAIEKLPPRDQQKVEKTRKGIFNRRKAKLGQRIKIK